LTEKGDPGRVGTGKMAGKDMGDQRKERRRTRSFIRAVGLQIL